MIKCFAIKTEKKDGKMETWCDATWPKVWEEMKNEGKCNTLECPFYKPAGEENCMRIGDRIVRR